MKVNWMGRCDRCGWVLMDNIRERDVPHCRYRSCRRACCGKAWTINAPPLRALVAAYIIGGREAVWDLLPAEDLYHANDMALGVQPGAYRRFSWS